MKKFLKYIPIFLAAIVLAVFFVPSFIPNTLTNAETYPGTKVKKDFINQSMFLEYAGNTLVGVDGEGFVYRSEEGTVDKLTKTGTQLQYVKKPEVDTSGNHSSIGNAYQKLLTFGNNILLFAGNNGSQIYIYKSIDQGKTWTVKNPGINISGSDGGYAYDLMFESDRFLLFTINSSLNSMSERSSLDGEKWKYHGADKDSYISWNINHADGYVFYSNIVDGSNVLDKKIVFSATSFEGEDRVSGYPSFLPIPVEDRNTEAVYQSAMTKIGNTFLAITPAGRVFTCTGNLQPWNSVGTIDYERIVKLYPYESGAIAVAICDAENKGAIFYIELQNNNVTTKLMYDNKFTDGWYVSNLNTNDLANTVAISDKHVTVGGNYLYMPRSSDVAEYECYSGFVTYTRNITHKVEFRDYNGNLLSSSDVNEGSCAIKPTDPSRTGYTFVGWDKDITLPITEDTVFTAIYEANLYNVTFKEETGDIISTVKVAYSTQIPSDKIPTPTKDGYQFIGWDKDTKALITGDITFTAKFSKYAYLTINYPAKSGTFGLLNQFKKTQMSSVQIKYTIGDIIDNSELKQFLAGIEGWTRDFDLDGKWDYDVKFLSWDKQLPTHITEDITLNATYEKLNLVRVVYYSQLRFNFKDNYYHTFIAQMNIEKLIETGSKIKIEDFKRSDVDYEIYNAQGAFYNNLVGFEFQGWDKDISETISADTVFTAQYKMPTFEITYYDADLYVIDRTNNQIDFMGIENLLEILNTSQENYNNFKNLFTLGVVQLNGEKVKEIAQKLDLNAYLNNLKNYNDKSTRLITPIIVIDSDRPNAYGGIFTSGSIDVDSAVLQPFAGNLKDHNKSYWISPVIFSTSAYSMTATVTFSNKLHSALKSFNMFFGAIGTFFKTAWNWIWKILIVAGIIALISFVLYIFKEPLRRTIDNANKKRIEQKQENQQTKQQLKQSNNNNYRSTKNNHYKSRRK